METPITNPGELVGTELSAVAFVRDYVEFHFDGPVLRSLSHPKAKVEGVEHRFPNPGSRDALCKAIGSVVRSISLIEGRALDMAMSNGCEITIPLDDLAGRGPEAMHFVPGLNKPIQIW